MKYKLIEPRILLRRINVAKLKPTKHQFYITHWCAKASRKKKGYTGYTNNFKVEAFYGFYFNELSQ